MLHPSGGHGHPVTPRDWAKDATSSLVRQTWLGIAHCRRLLSTSQRPTNLTESLRCGRLRDRAAFGHSTRPHATSALAEGDRCLGDVATTPYRPGGAVLEPGLLSRATAQGALGHFLEAKPLFKRALAMREK